MQAWGPERSIHATVLRRLLLDTSEPIDPRGIRLAGVRIVGELDLTSATIIRPLLLHFCQLGDGQGVVLDYAALDRLEFTHCQIAGLTARRVKISQLLHLRGTSMIGYPMILAGGQIGQLTCAGAHLTGADQNGNALVGDRLRIDGDAFLTNGFTAAGAVRLSGAHITGQLACNGAQLTGTDKDLSLIHI